jgi:hypothetical protein
MPHPEACTVIFIDSGENYIEKTQQQQKLYIYIYLYIYICTTFSLAMWKQFVQSLHSSNICISYEHQNEHSYRQCDVHLSGIFWSHIFVKSWQWLYSHCFLEMEWT